MSDLRAVYVRSGSEYERISVEDYDGSHWTNVGRDLGVEIEWWDLPAAVVDRFRAAQAEYEAAESALFEAQADAPRHGWSAIEVHNGARDEGKPDE